jgi:membrane associated rhomboid family serine protease
MIDARCECGVGYRVPESEIGTASPPCPRCGRVMRVISAEALPDGAGAADFDTRLVIIGGPDRAGEQLLLGGCCEIEVGKLPGRHVQLTGEKVSRLHCKLVRLDFGPSRWQILDNRSTNGLFVNGQRITDPCELKDGDVIQLGEYKLRYGTDAALAAMQAVVAAPVAAIPVGGATCPGCKKDLFPGAAVCIDCGIYVPSGRPLITSRAIDQDRVDEVARETFWTISWFTLLGAFPVASEAFGHVKPKAIKAITFLTIACTFFFFPVACGWIEKPSPQVQNLMQWTGNRALRQAEIDEQLQELKKYEDELAPYSGSKVYYTRQMREIEAAKQAVKDQLPPPSVKFYPHQLLTSVVLHEGIFHLGFNLLFFLVFGLRVNELIGNLKTFISAVLLAAAEGMSNYWGTRYEPLTPSLGLSGVVAGFAGMYLVFFPVHRVRIIAYLNLYILTAFQVFRVLFWLRGFWLLLAWFLWNDVIPLALGWSTGAAHWSHLGGFGAGILLACALLVSRQVSARGDIFTVAIGKYAWPLVGRPVPVPKGTPVPAAAAEPPPPLPAPQPA